MIKRSSVPSRLGFVFLSFWLASCGGIDATDGSGSEAALGSEEDALSSAKPVPAFHSDYVKEQAYFDYVSRQKEKEAMGLLAVIPSLETLQKYAALCEDATGVRVPPFSCENGYEVPEGTQQIDLASFWIGQTVGSYALDNLVGTVTARGNDIYGPSDQFFFLTTPIYPPALVNGDGFLEVKVRSLTNTDPYTKAGIMFRSGLAADAINVAIFITPGHGVSFQRRTTTPGSTATTELPGKSAPVWLRLTRMDNKFRGYVTSDRITWTQVGPEVTLNGFPTAPYAGFALTSHNANVTATATFETLQWMKNEDPKKAKCDRPNVLNNQCDPGSRFQMLAQSGDGAVAAHCRKQGKGTGKYGDIAIIQYNKVSGGLCFYQAGNTDANGAALPDGIDGTNVPAPLVTSTAPNFRWFNPAETRAVGCPHCHDNGAFIRSPYLVQTGLLPNIEDKYDNKGKIAWVGADYAQERSWSITAPNAPGDTGENCNSCHRLSVNNNEYAKGTAAEIALIATGDDGAQPLKNPHSTTSPIWMRRGQVGYNSGAYATAANYSECAKNFWLVPGTLRPVGFTDGTRNLGNCSYSATPVGKAWVQPTYNPYPIGISNGTLTLSGTQVTITAKGTDIYGAQDEFLFGLAGNALTDGMATVKVNSITPGHPFAKAGIMFRNTVAASSPHVMLDITPSSGAQFQYRLTDPGSTTPSTPLGGRAAPVWLRMYKTGTVVSSWVSNDYLTWNQVAPAIDVPGLSPGIGLAVTSHDTNASTTAVFDRFSWVPADDALADANIGLLTGTRTLSGNNRVIQVAGTGVGGTNDQFFYSFKRANGGIYVKVNSLSSTPTSAKAGLMMRSSIDAASRYVMLSVTPGSGVQFQYRATDGGAVPTPTTITGIAAPIWLWLSRGANNLYTGKYSTDGTTWIQVGSATVAMPVSTMLEGVAVTSQNANAATTANVSKVLSY